MSFLVRGKIEQTFLGVLSAHLSCYDTRVGDDKVFSWETNYNRWQEYMMGALCTEIILLWIYFSRLCLKSGEANIIVS